MKYYVLPKNKNGHRRVLENAQEVISWYKVDEVILPVIGNMRIKIEKENIYLTGYIKDTYFIVDERHIGGKLYTYLLYDIARGIAEGKYTLYS